MYSFMRTCTWSSRRQEAGYRVLAELKTQVSISPSGQRSCLVVYAINASEGLAAADQRAGAFREQFEQDCMRHASVEDDSGFDAAIDRAKAGLDLGDHAARDRAFGYQPPGFRRGQLGDQEIGRASCRERV